MKQLILIRHAKARSADKYEKDFDRELKTKGVEQAIATGKRLISRKIEFTKIISSTAIRAKQTTLLIVEKIKPNQPNLTIEYDRRIYTGDVLYLNELIQSQSPKMKTIAIVGHNMTLTELAQKLLPDFKQKIPKSGVVAIETTAATWRKISSENCTLLFSMKPFE